MRLRARLQAGEGGFTLVELLVALTVFVIAITSLAYTATIAFSDIGLARLRQTANGLATQALEQARAIPFDTIKAGLSSNDSTVTSDSNITACGANKCYRGEQIPISAYAAGTTIKPLVPHTTTVTIGSETFTTSVYVTYYNNQPTSNELRVTAVANWASSIRAGAAHSVELQTVVYSPQGCQSTATHPFSAPCQPFLYALASTDPTAIVITGSVQGANLQEADLVMLGENSNMQLEQTNSVSGAAIESGATLTLTSQTQQTAGSQTVSSHSDSDPGNPGPDYQSVTAPGSGGTTLTASGTGSNALILTTPAGDSGSTTSTIDATISPSHPCADRTGANQTDGWPCGSSKSGMGGTLSGNLTLSNGSVNLGTALLASIAAPVSPTYPNLAHTARSVPVGDGITHGDLTRTLGTVTFADLPSGMAAALKPAAWGGYLVLLTNYTDSVTAEAGVGAAKPTVTASGTISFWNGNGYTSCSVTSTACLTNGSWPVSTVTISGQQGGNQLSITITASVKPGGTSVTDPAGCSNACTRTQASATAGSPITGTITYRVDWGGNNLANLTMTVDLGSLLTNATYQPAPSAT